MSGEVLLLAAGDPDEYCGCGHQWTAHVIARAGLPAGWQFVRCMDCEFSHSPRSASAFLGLEDGDA